MRVSRSLTIKQMAAVFAVVMVFVAVFIVVLLFHFVQQSRYTTATQMESIAHSVRRPLSAAILKADIPQAEAILSQIQPSGILSRADVVLPNQFQALRVSFVTERSVPVLMARIFELPVQISLPLYSLERPANPQPLAYLVLQADSWRMYRTILSTISTLVTAWLLLVLVLTVGITWCINRLIVHPLRRMGRELNDISPQDAVGHQLKIPALHHDDEIGLLVRSYNRNQQAVRRQQDEQVRLSTRFPGSELPNKALLQALVEQDLQAGKPLAMIVLASETLQESAGVLNEEQREALVLTLVSRLQQHLPAGMVLAQVNLYDFAVLARGITDPWQAMQLARQLLAAVNEKLPLNAIYLRPSASVGIAMRIADIRAEQLLRRAVSAAFAARQMGKNQIQFFDPEQMVRAQQRLTEENDILGALENEQFALWLQPQIRLSDERVASVEVLLRQQQPDGSWTLPDGLIDRIESCGLMVTVGNWVLESAVRLLSSWQRRGVEIPVSVNISALQLVQPDLVERLMTLLQRYAIAPGSLILEVTESRRIDDPQAAVNILRPLRHAGVRIALDDFGMGYASLHQLHHMKSVPVDILKIDKNFVSGLPEDGSIVSLILTMARNLNLEAIAEGVETEAQLNWLREAGVEIVQGYLFARAMSPEAFTQRYLTPDSDDDVKNYEKK
ncbi:biofilm formation regulator HmsP [Entomohabitans teleogrylli]|uniref:biofilm formation regulator HmsP n=1 Tax=Entomohabitans teleogrylli TaxID=1384589 RepID=UPI00073D6FCE|nr:biofilm formation regulator HmsP [Entomohabitans teleogrylli]